MSEEAVMHLRTRPTVSSAPALLKVPEAAARLQVSERTFWRWLHTGSVPHVRLGEDERIVRIPVDLLDEWWLRRLEGNR
jgi:excisionase family DNA binding protein